MTALDRLIANLEAAKGGSRYLDHDIAVALPGPMRLGIGPRGHEYPHYTTSLDAALMLVPYGWVWMVQIDFELPGRAHLHSAPTDQRPINKSADGASPALALCIAALRAKQTEETSDG